jgi:excisionase family DNA binding protein
MEREPNVSLVAAARRLGVSPHTLRTWSVYRRRIPFLRLGRRLLFRPRDLEHFEQANLVTAAARDEGVPRR